MPTVSLGSREIGDGQPVLIIAEIGKNHDGSVGQAKKLIDAAAEAGVDAVKFQTHLAAEEMTQESPVPSHFPEPRFQYISRVQLDREAHRELFAYATEKGLICLSTPFSRAAADLLEELSVPAYKIGSGETTDLPLLEHVAKKARPILMSTGMASFAEIETAVQTVRRWNDQLILLQCTSLYPCPYDKVNLRAIETLRNAFGLPVGMSDHTATIYTAIAAVALGACVVEKHFTLSKRLYGPDHQASLEPIELKQLVTGIRAVEQSLGTGDKDELQELQNVRLTFQKSVVARQSIPAGMTLEPGMLTVKRPGTGIPASRLAGVVGRRTARALDADTVIKEEDLV